MLTHTPLDLPLHPPADHRRLSDNALSRPQQALRLLWHPRPPDGLPSLLLPAVHVHLQCGMLGRHYRPQ